MKKDTFYFVLRHKNNLLTAFKFELYDYQTIISVPTIVLKDVHSTLHQVTGSYKSPILQIREVIGKNTYTLLRSDRGLQSPQLQDLGQIMIDLDIHANKLKIFKKKSFTDCDILNTHDFGRYLTFYIFQGRSQAIKAKANELLKTKRATTVIPHNDGFRLHSPKYPVKYALYIFKGTRKITVGILALGHNYLNEKASQILKDNNTKQSVVPIQYIAFGSNGQRVTGRA